MADNANASVGCGFWLIVSAVIGGVTYYQQSQREKNEEQAVLRAADLAEQRLPELLKASPKPAAPSLDFWPGTTQTAPEGYLMSERYIPLRAIARKPNVSMFRDLKDLSSVEVEDIMKTWYPYYIFQRTATALHLGESPGTPPADRKWVKESDCFCWTTRECISFEQPCKVYASRQDAEKQANPINGTYAFRFAEHFESGAGGKKGQRFRIASLPVLRREEGNYWCFVRPEGTEDVGYSVGWVQWDGSDPGNACRLRMSRVEFEQYLADLRTIMIDWRNQEKQSAATVDMYRRGTNYVTQDEQASASLLQIEGRRKGIPKPGGFLEQPIESPLQYEKISDRVIRLIELSSSDIWDINDVAYIPVDKMP